MCFCPFLESQLYTSLLRNELLRDDIDTLTVSSKISLIAQTIFAIIRSFRPNYFNFDDDNE